MGAPIDAVGGAFCGNIVAAIIFGVFTVQVVLYYKQFPEDGKWVKLTVAIPWVVIGFQLVCTTGAIWRPLITDYFTPLKLTQMTWETSIYQLCGTVSSVVAQTFFVNRIWNLHKSLFIVASVQFLIAIQFVSGIAIAVNANLMHDFEALVRRDYWLVGVWLATQAACDVLIAVIMTILLRRIRPGFRQTDNAIKTMIYSIVCTGAITCVLSIVVLLTFARYGFEFSVLLIGVPLGTLYPVSMLTSLHMRSRVRERLSENAVYCSRPDIPLNVLFPSQVVTMTHEQRSPTRPTVNSIIIVTVDLNTSPYAMDSARAEIRCRSAEERI